MHGVREFFEGQIRAKHPALDARAIGRLMEQEVERATDPELSIIVFIDSVRGVHSAVEINLPETGKDRGAEQAWRSLMGVRRSTGRMSDSAMMHHTIIAAHASNEDHEDLRLHFVVGLSWLIGQQVTEGRAAVAVLTSRYGPDIITYQVKH